MPTIFRKIRWRLARNNKFFQYWRYAIGEIVLVVFGILIALQINSWQEEQRKKKLEQRYLTDLIEDMQKDSTNLLELKKEADRIARSKSLLTALIDGRVVQVDSVDTHFKNQWLAYKTFNPVTITMDEMKNSSNLDVISGHALKREIVGLYNLYNLLQQDEKLYHESTRSFLELSRKHLKDINRNTEQEVIKVLEIPEVTNTLRTNFATGRKEAIEQTFEACCSTLSSIRKYMKQK